MDSCIGEFSVKSSLCPVRNVTVFQDQAEVSRFVELEAVSGNTSVTVTDLPASIKEDSIRVASLGDAVILEVQYQSRAVVSDNVSGAEDGKAQLETQKANQELDLLTKKKKLLAEEGKRLEAKDTYMETFMGNVLTLHKDDSAKDIVDTGNVTNVFSLIQQYVSVKQSVAAARRDLNNRTALLQKEIEVVKANLSRLNPQCSTEDSRKASRSVKVLLDVATSGKLKLVVSYLVSGAKWNPLYDVRVFSKESSLQIQYYALVSQQTGEDWDEAKLLLSTALPSIGGCPPDLQTQTLSFWRPKQRLTYMMGANDVMAFESCAYRTLGHVLSDYDPTIEDSYYAPKPAPEPEAQVLEGMMSTTFEIARLSTIKSDSTSHKVSICQVDLKPDFEYFAVPKSVEHAFLKVKARNESAYALLAGPASVFLDNNFVTKSNMPAVSPLEDFEVPVGVDPSIKVTYKPLSKFTETSGIVSKSTILKCYQQIDLKNTRALPVKMKVTDQYPISDYSQLKVSLLKPELKMHGSDSKKGGSDLVRIGDACISMRDHKIEWTIEIPGFGEKSISFSYEVESPFGARLTGL